MNRRAFLSSLALAGATVAVPAVWIIRRDEAIPTPSDVLLIRHAEEPEHGPHLSDRGRERANALIKLFASRFPRPTALFASRSTNASERPVETLQPLSLALGLDIEAQYLDGQYREQASTVRNSPKYSNGHVLICWHHSTLPKLARALGVADPPDWPESEYDRLWFIRYEGREAKLTQEAQKIIS